jgi:hypothetical protein
MPMHCACLLWVVCHFLSFVLLAHADATESLLREPACILPWRVSGVLSCVAALPHAGARLVEE